MARNRKIVGIWPKDGTEPPEGADGWDGQDESEIDPAAGEEAAQGAEPEPDADPDVDLVAYEDTNDWNAAAPPRRRDISTPGLLLGIAAAAWTGFFIWANAYSGFDFASPGDWLAAAPTLAMPLVLIATIYLIIQRSSIGEANRYGTLMADLDRRTAALQHKLSAVNSYLVTAHREMRAEAERLSATGLDVGGRIAESGSKLRGEMAETVTASTGVAEQTTAAMERLDALLAGLPRVEAVASRMTETLKQAGLVAHKHGSALEVQIANLREEGEATETAVDASVARIEQRIAALKADGAALRETVDEAGAAVSERMANALREVEAALASARDAARDHAEEVIRTATEGRTKIDEGAAAFVEQTRSQLDEAEQRVGAIGTDLGTHATHANEMAHGLGAALGEAGERLNALDAEWNTALAALTTSIAELSGRSEALNDNLVRGREEAGGLIDKADAVMLALDSIAREIDEAMPRAIARLEAQLSETGKLLGNVAPSVAELSASGETALAKFTELQMLLEDQGSLSGAQAKAATNMVDEYRSAMSELAELQHRIATDADQISESAAPRLVEVMARVRDTATLAANHARDAIDAVMADAGKRIRTAADHVLSEALDESVTVRVDQLSSVSERALAAAQGASHELEAQLRAIVETSEAIETRTAEAKAVVSEIDRDSLARHVVLLTESLKSTAIDVTKLLSNEVSDSAWEAYLKGDRGVFTRRAVKLLDASEAREVLGLYRSDADFHEYVDRYVRDFEAMLRSLNGTRDGNALSITLLSSDMGKLYVALAQAIERLRG